MAESQAFRSFAVVELFGHTQVAGLLTEQVIGGETFVRVDVPHPEGEYTRLFGKGAIYAINLCDEETAKRYAQRITPPLKPYIPPPVPSRPQLGHDDDEFEDEDPQ